MRRPAAAADRQAPARAVAGVSWNRGAKDADAPIVRHAPQPRWQRLRNEKALHGAGGAGLCKWLLDLGSNQGPTDEQSGALPTELSRNKPAIIYTEHAPQMLRRQPAPSDAATPNAPNAPESQAETAETGATPIHASRVSVGGPPALSAPAPLPRPRAGGVRGGGLVRGGGWGGAPAAGGAGGRRRTPHKNWGAPRHQRVRFVFYDS